LAFPPFVYTERAYAVAVGLAISRCVAVGERALLLPVLELANHDGRAPTAYVAADAAGGGGMGGGVGAAAAALFGGDAGAGGACVSLLAATDLPVGTPVTLRYGGTAGELLLDHGFVLEPVPPRVSFEFELDENDAFFDEKCDVLEGGGLAARARWALDEGDTLPDELLAFLRLKLLRGEDAFLLEPVLSQSLWPEHLPLPVSRDNERATLAELAAAAARGLSQLGGSVQDDLRTLASAGGEDDATARRARSFAAVRYAERRALQWVARSVETRAASLGGLTYYQERRLAAFGLSPIESEAELDTLKAAGRAYSKPEFEW
jgi:hypothetical protein